MWCTEKQHVALKFMTFMALPYRCSYVIRSVEYEWMFRTSSAFHIIPILSFHVYNFGLG